MTHWSRKRAGVTPRLPALNAITHASAILELQRVIGLDKAGRRVRVAQAGRRPGGTCPTPARFAARFDPFERPCRRGRA